MNSPWHSLGFILFASCLSLQLPEIDAQTIYCSLCTSPGLLLQNHIWRCQKFSLFSSFFHSAWEIYCACYSNTFQKQNWSFDRKSGWQDIVLSYSRGSLGWTLGRISSHRRWSDMGMGCPGGCWSYCPRGCLRKHWIWHSVPWFCWHGVFSHRWDSVIISELYSSLIESVIQSDVIYKIFQHRN